VSLGRVERGVNCLYNWADAIIYHEISQLSIRAMVRDRRVDEGRWETVTPRKLRLLMKGKSWHPPLPATANNKGVAVGGLTVVNALWRGQDRMWLRLRHVLTR
jgi:hypothetical protein